MLKTIIVIVAIASLAACAQTPAQRAAVAQAAVADQAGLDRELAGLVPTDTAACISNIDTRFSTSVKAYGPTLVYTVSPRLKYRTDTGGGCERIARGDTLVTVSNGGQLCRGDIARTIDPTARVTTGTCGLGEFVRYEPAGKR